MPKPFSQACENNKAPILEVLKQYFTEPGVVLEIGSGTGQHAVYFAEQLPNLVWQPSDRENNISGITQWLEAARLVNIAQPLILDVEQHAWVDKPVDYLFSANTVHIMSWSQVERMLAGVGRQLKPDGCFCLYGPFNYNGRYTADSNARFDLWLKQRDPLSGIRNFEDLDALAQQAGLRFIDCHLMPANNRVLVWQKLPVI